MTAPRPAAAALVSAALAWAGAACTQDDPARLRVLEADRRAKEVQLDTLLRAGESDLRLRDLRRSALGRAQGLDEAMLTGERAFLLVRAEWFQQVASAVMPVHLKAGAFKWRFTKADVSLQPDGVRVELAFQVVDDQIKKRLGRAASGVLSGVLLPELPPKGRLQLRWKPLVARLDDKDFRVASIVFRTIGINAFDALLPPLPIPLGPAPYVECCGRRADLAVELVADDAVALRQGLLIPFAVQVDTVAAAPPPTPAERGERPPAPAAGGPARSPAPPPGDEGLGGGDASFD